MNPVLLQLAQAGLAAAINAIMANEETNRIIRGMVQDGRTRLLPDEERDLNAQSDAIHQAHMAAIEKAKAEGR